MFFLNGSAYFDCAIKQDNIIEIPKDTYKGFKISMIGNDSAGTKQLCIGKIELIGEIFTSNKYITCAMVKYKYLHTSFINIILIFSN